MVDKSYLDGFQYDEQGNVVGFRDYAITSWADCPIHGRYAKTYGDELSQWEIKCGCPSCFKNQMIEEQLKSAMIPPRFLTKTLDNFETAEEWQRKASAIIRSYVSDFDSVLSQGRCLILCGLPGTGKTHLACAYANEVIKQGHSASFTSVSKIIRTVRASWGTGTEEDVLQTFSNVDLLVIDEVGVQAGTENEKQILFNILNERYNFMRPTVLISNLKQVEMKTALGERVWDRLKENGGKLINLTGDSFRK